jgi:hypothetical protein
MQPKLLAGWMAAVLLEFRKISRGAGAVGGALLGENGRAIRLTIGSHSFAPSRGVGLEEPLKIRSVDVLPAEEPGIDRPEARSHHRQTHAQDRQHDRNPWIAGVRERDPHLSDG